MKISVVTKVRIGFSLAICVAVVAVELIAAGGIDIHHSGEAIACLALGLAGLLVWATSELGRAKPADSATTQAAPAGEHAQEDPLAPFKSCGYWGKVLILSATTLALVSAYRYTEAKPMPVAPVPKPAGTVPTPAPAVTFPPLKLEGLVVRGTQSSAIINGQVLLIGEGIGYVRLVAVDAEHATVEMDGQTNVLSLPR